MLCHIRILVLVQPSKTLPDTTEKIVDWDVKNESNKQTIISLRMRELVAVFNCVLAVM